MGTLFSLLSYKVNTYPFGPYRNSCSHPFGFLYQAKVSAFFIHCVPQGCDRSCPKNIMLLSFFLNLGSQRSPKNEWYQVVIQTLHFLQFSTEHYLGISLVILEDHWMFQGIKSLIEDFVKRNQPILFYNLKPSIVEIFQGVQPKDFKYCRNEIELNELLKGKQRRATVA